jgi:hypothetical protein
MPERWSRSQPTLGQSVLAGAAVSLGLLLGAVYSGSVPVGLSNPQSARWEFEWNLNGGIADERGVWVGGTDRGIMNIVNNLALAFVQPDFVWPSTGQSMSRSLRDIDKAAKNWPIGTGYVGPPADVDVRCGGLGSLGMVTGPTVHLIDDCALTDRFLAERVFSAQNFQWRIGDFHRVIPDGYVEAIRENDSKLVKNQLDGFKLQELWNEIRPPVAQVP